MEKHYLHHVPGRIRIRTPELKRDAAHAAGAHSFLRNTRGVISVDLNPVTGSVTATYAVASVDGEQLIALLAARGYVDPEHAASAFHLAAERAGKTIASALTGMLLNRLIGNTPFAVITAIV